MYKLITMLLLFLALSSCGGGSSTDPSATTTAGWHHWQKATVVAVSFSPSTTDFGSVPVGSQSADATITMTNKGTGSLLVLNDFFQLSSPDFIWSPNSGTCWSGTSYAPGASCTITIRFAPQSAGTKTAIVTATGITQTAALTGVGTDTTTPPPPTTTSGAAGPTITTFTPSGPITIYSGQTITGMAISNPNGACIYGNGVSNIHIYNNKIGPCGPNADDTGINLNNAHDVLVEHNSFDDISGGLYVTSSTSNIVFDHNYATRIRGPFPRGQLVQFNTVNGSGNKITCNVSDQTSPGYGNGTEDHINTWLSSGTAASPIMIQYNKLRGGGPSNSGGGIVAGDGGGSYITVDSNILVNPGQYGISIAGGHDNKLLNNKVYSSAFAWTNIGSFVWNQYSPAAYNEEVSGNRVKWLNSSGVENDWWDGGNSGTIAMSNNVFGDSTLSTSIWGDTITQCQ